MMGNVGPHYEVTRQSNYDEIDLERDRTTLNTLDPGEQAAITLAQTLPADLLIIDELWTTNCTRAWYCYNRHSWNFG
ncbi:hypothetical protein [Chlorogloeopsis sp. ULAP02]|uniref:hypothetical protein n=1 Tax=Chlorogloeopsis sp. ULAP02 TaxID=3107926 RepID=UPI003134E027